MALADLQNTTFGNDPRKSLEVTDIYDAEAIDAFASGASDSIDTNILTDTYPSLRADKILSSLKDNSVTNYLRDKGITFDSLVKAANKAIPPGVSLDNLMSEGSLVHIVESFDSLKPLMSPSEWTSIDAVYASDIMSSYSEFANDFGLMSCDPCNGYCGPTADSNGLTSGSSNPAIDAAKLWADLKKLIICGLANAALDVLIGKEGLLPEGTLKTIAAGMAAVSAIKKTYDNVKKWIDYAAEKFGWKQQNDVISNTLKTYTLPVGLELEDYPQESMNVVDFLNSINPNWLYTTWNGEQTLSTHYFQFINPAFINVLKYHPEAGPAVVTYFEHNPEGLTVRNLTNQYFPFVLL